MCMYVYIYVCIIYILSIQGEATRLIGASGFIPMDEWFLCVRSLSPRFAGGLKKLIGPTEHAAASCTDDAPDAFASIHIVLRRTNFLFPVSSLFLYFPELFETQTSISEYRKCEKLNRAKFFIASLDIGKSVIRSQVAVISRIKNLCYLLILLRLK